MRKVDKRKLQMEESFNKSIENVKTTLEVKGISEHFEFELVYVPRYLLVKQKKESIISEKAFEKLVNDNRLKMDING